MPDPNAPVPRDPEMERQIREIFKPQPRELPDHDERFRELERKIRKPA